MARPKSTVEAKINEIQLELQIRFAEWQTLLLQYLVLSILSLVLAVLWLFWNDRLIFIVLPSAFFAGAWKAKKDKAQKQIKELQEQLKTLWRAK